MEEKTDSSENVVPKCPRCGGPLQDGYVMAPRGLWWDTKPRKIVALGGEKIISQWSLTIPNAPAQRCLDCGTIII